MRMLEVPFAFAAIAEFTNERTVRLEDLKAFDFNCCSIARRCSGAHLHAMIFLIAHINEAERIRGDAPRIVEFAVGRSLCAKRTQESTRWVEYLDAVIVTIRDDILSDSIDCDAGQTIEFTLPVAVLAEFLHENTIRIENLNSAKRVGD